jgi:hypothetical protein
MIVDDPAEDTQKGMPGAHGESAGEGDAKATPRRERVTGHGSKFGRKKAEAIAALLAQPTLEEAARVTGISPQTLSRWKKISEFEAAYDEGLNAIGGQAVARLQHAAGVAVTVLLRAMQNPRATPAERLRAAARILSYSKVTTRIADIGARLTALERTRAAEQPDNREGAAVAEERESARAGQRAKFGRRKQAAIMALLTQRNFEEAARVAGIGTTTLYRWVKDAQFITAYRVTRLAAFGRANARLQQAAGMATTVILKIMVDPATPAGVPARAADLVLKYAIAASEEDLAALLEELKQRPLSIREERGAFEEIAGEHPRKAA